MLKSYFCALDIGSSKIAAVVALMKKNKIVDLFFDSVVAKGVKNGVIIDPIELSDVINKLVKSLKNKSGIKIKDIHVNISGQDVIVKHSSAVIPLTERGNKLITSTDIDRATQQALLLGSNIDEEIIHHIPYKYVIGGSSDVVNPLGLYSNRLEVELILICGKLSVIQSLTHVIHQAGCEIRSVSFASLANCAIIYNDEFKKGTSVVCDFGSDVTEVLIFKNGFLKSVKVFNFGGKDLTLVLVDSLGISWDLAEDIKISNGVLGSAANIDDKEEILVKKDQLYKPLKKKLVSDILTSKTKIFMEELKHFIEKETNLFEINKFVVSGRATVQEGFLELIENTIGINVEFAKINDNQMIYFLSNNENLVNQKYLNYLTALGIICLERNNFIPKKYNSKSKIKNPGLKFIERVKEVYHEYF